MLRSRLAFALLALALLLRLGAALAAADIPLTSDPLDFDRHARSIAAGNGYPESIVAPEGGPTAVRPPGYPYLLGAVYALTGDSILAGRLSQAIIGTIAVALVGLLARQLWGCRAGMVALAIAAVYPPLIIAGGSLFTEPLFITLMLAAANASLRFRATRHAAWLVGTAIAGGLAVLTRENGLVLLLPLAIAVWGPRPWLSLRALAAPASLIVIAALVVAPWTLRNAVAFDAFVPVTTTAPYTLAGTYNETSRQDAMHPAGWRPPNLDPTYAGILEEESGDEAALGEAFWREVRSFVAENPSYVAEAGLHNFIRIFHLDGLEWGRQSVSSTVGFRSLVADVGTVAFLVCAALALLGAWTREARNTPIFVWMMPLLLIASVVFVRSVTRFRIPADVFLVLLAALGVLALVELGRRHRSRLPRPANE